MNRNLLSLPPDILLSIADFTPEASLNSLAQTTSSLHNLLDAALYRSNIRRSHSSALLWACLHGHATVAHKLLALHADPNTTALRRRCRKLTSLPGPSSSLLHALESDIRRGQLPGLGMPLVYAAAGGHVEIMAMLIAHGADVHRTAPLPRTLSRHKTTTRAPSQSQGSKKRSASVSTCCHYTPLMMAADRGQTAAIELLLAHGVDVNVPGARCHSPLSIAAVNGHISAMRTLLRHGADVNLVRRGGTALVMAIQARRIDAVKELLQAGADLFVPIPQHLDPILSSAVLCAISMDDPEMLSVLLQYAPQELERQDAIGRTPLAYAAWEEKPRALDTLLAHGAEVNARTNRPHGQTPLWWAVLGNCVPVAKSLLCAGADPECLALVNGSLTSVLTVAMERFYYDIVDVLLELGADPNANDGRALSLAVQQGENALVEKMLEQGADPNIRDPATASTALYWTLANRNIRMMRCLLEHGASPHNLVKSKGRQRGRVSPVVCAMKSRLWAAVALLITHGADPEQSWDGTPVLVKAVGTGDQGLVRLLIAHGACVDVIDRHGRTPSSLARSKGISIDAFCT